MSNGIIKTNNHDENSGDARRTMMTASSHMTDDGGLGGIVLGKPIGSSSAADAGQPSAIPSSTSAAAAATMPARADTRETSNADKTTTAEAGDDKEAAGDDKEAAGDDGKPAGSSSSAAAVAGKGGESSSSPPPKDSSDESSGGDNKKQEEQPDGGYDPTPLPRHDFPTYTIRFTFHKATHLPVADLQNAAADPYLLVQLNMPEGSNVGQRHKQDPPLRWRSVTRHATRDPEWEDTWVVAGVPAPPQGPSCTLKIRIMDEDKSDHDDRMGDVKIRLDGLGTSTWKDVHKRAYEIQKRKAKKRVNMMRFCCASVDVFSRPRRGRESQEEELVVSIEVLGETQKEDEVGKAYTIGPLRWRQHYSPMIGRVAGTEQPKEGEQEKQQGEKTEPYDFQANELQLCGPVPNELYHRFVDFKSFVHGMFESTGVRGRVLHKALKYQHNQLYRFDKRTETGVVDDDDDEDKGALARRFLELAHWDEGGRIFTYVVTLDGLLRFTETGKEFGIDLLSKHTMHSDVNVYIAWSGEFLIRRLARAGTEDGGTHPADDLPGGPPHDPPPKDPEHYELIIDNDSGTYRPNADLIPIFQKFLERNFHGLKIRVFNGFDKELEKIKKDQLEIKHREGDRRTFVQDGSEDGLSSSDEEELDARATSEKKKKGGLGKAVAGLEDPKGQLKNMNRKK